MKKFSLNKIAVIGLALGGLCVFSSTAVMAAEECKPKVTNPDNGENPDDGTPPTGATGGAGEFSTASAFNGIPRVSEFSEQETQETRGDCGATVGESSGTQAQEVAMTIGTKIINQRAARKRSGNTGQQVTAFDFQAFGGSASADADDDSLRNGSRISLFSFGEYSERDRKGTALSSGYEQELSAFTLGFDYRLDDATFLGMTVSGSEGESDLDSGNGGSEVSSTTLGIHGAKYWGNNFVAGFLAYGSLDIDVSRSTAADSFSASTDGDYWYGDIAVGFEENYGGLRITPQARVLFLSGDIDAYRERSGSGAGVIRSVDGQDIDTTILTLSVQADYPVLLSWGVLLPSMRAELISDSGDGYSSNGQTLNDADKSAISTFADQADDPDSSTVSVSWGTSAQFRSGFAAYVVYERLFFHDYLDKYTATVGLRYELP